MKFLFFNIVKKKTVIINIFVSLDAYYFFYKILHMVDVKQDLFVEKGIDLIFKYSYKKYKIYNRRRKYSHLTLFGGFYAELFHKIH